MPKIIWKNQEIEAPEFWEKVYFNKDGSLGVPGSPPSMKAYISPDMVRSYVSERVLGLPDWVVDLANELVDKKSYDRFKAQIDNRMKSVKMTEKYKSEILDILVIS